jgi:hypothetical protein
MRIFIERFILTILASFVVLLAAVNPMGFSWPLRLIGIIFIVVVAGMAAHFAGWDEWRWQRLRGVWWFWSIFGLSGGVALALWFYPRIVGSTEPPVVIHDPPSAEDIAKASAPIQKQLNAVTQQRDAALAEIASLGHRRGESSQTTPAPPTYADDHRVYTTKTVAGLMAFYEGRTGLQGDIFMADEIGKWINTEGKLQNIQPDATVILQVAKYAVTCIFGPQWRLKLSAFRDGDIMKIAGKIIPGQTGGSIYLHDCELRD